jgi:zinc transport system ATP-binding protein
LKPLVELQEVTVQREGRTLLEKVSLEVKVDSIHVLVGPNGAGKSTLFSCLLGLADFAGSIQFHFRGNGRIGYVPQRFTVDRTLPLTVGEFLVLRRRRRPVCFGLSPAARAQAEELLARVSLQGFSDRPLSALSGGEQQRVLLANALDPLPELLLLDEPASGLDEPSLEAFETTLLALKTTVFMVSHDLEQARRVADQVTVLDRSVRKSGPPAKALEHGLRT